MAVDKSDPEYQKVKGKIAAILRKHMGKEEFARKVVWPKDDTGVADEILAIDEITLEI